MPLLTLETNIQPDDISTCLAELSGMTAKMLGKPENFVMVTRRYNPDMLFAGSNQPLAFLQLKSLDLPEDRTAEFSDALCELVRKHLGIQPSRVYIEFISPDRHMWGWNSATF